ncbi:TPA: outer membrane usher protein [Citrobacter koseri]
MNTALRNRTIREQPFIAPVSWFFKGFYFLLFYCILPAAYAADHIDDIQFNTDVLDVKDRSNIDLGQFSRKGYVMPGEYTLTLRINKQELDEQQVNVYAPDDDPEASNVCLTRDLVSLFSIKSEYTDKLTWWHQGECLDLGSLEGSEARADLSSNSLVVSIPQAYLEYSSESWDPPSRWDNGIPGVMFDYNINAQSQHNEGGNDNNSFSGNGTTGANFGPWRFRADWQTQYQPDNSNSSGDTLNWDWSRYYLYRALPTLGARLTLGEDYLYSDIFDSLRFIGGSLVTEDNMLPPNLRGYAPEVSGVADTNAKVTISQQGRVIYETQVAAGPFRIQDLNQAVSGKLDVRVEEQSGRIQEFQVDTASVPYLTRPGMIRYKFATGRPSKMDHKADGPTFATGEFSWGINSGWSLFGGAMGSEEYNAFALGIGRDLLAFGAISVDVTQSFAHLDNRGDINGRSYRASYSKSFDATDSKVTFAGYRFSEKEYLSMSDYLNVKESDDETGKSKEMYTITFSQPIRSLGLSAYLNYSHQTYWDRPADDRYNLSISRSMDIGSVKNISLSLSAYRNKNNGQNDDGMYLSASVPWGNGASVSYSSTLNRDDNSHRVSYYDRFNEYDSYQISAGYGRKGANSSGYLTHQGDMAQVNLNASYQEGQYRSLSASLQGGMTATTEGAAVHRNSRPGGTRMLLDTDGVADIPVKGFGASTRTNRFGKAVVGDISNYYRNKLSVDLNQLPDNAEATRSVVQATLTEGAIGYRRFDIVSGEKAMAVIRLADGTYPPFGAMIHNHKEQNVGIVNDEGQVYLSGINAGERMFVSWGESSRCEIDLPQSLPDSEELMASLLLPCAMKNMANSHDD